MTAITQAQAEQLHTYFKPLKAMLNDDYGLERVFNSKFMASYSLPFDGSDWMQQDRVPARGRDLEYYKETTAGLRKLATGLQAYVDSLMGRNVPDELRNKASIENVSQLLLVVVGYREQRAAQAAQNAKLAAEFLNSVFADFNMHGFKRVKFSKYENQHTALKRLELLGAVEPTQTAIELRIWKPGGEVSVRRKIAVYNGDSVEVVRGELQTAWTDMVNSVVEKSKAQDAKLIELKFADRKPTDPEIELIGNMLAVSNLGQSMRFDVTDDTLVMNGTKLDLNNLQRCAGHANRLLDVLCEDRDTERAVESERKSWGKILRGQDKSFKGKGDTLFTIANTWKDFLPLCLWLAQNNK